MAIFKCFSVNLKWLSITVQHSDHLSHLFGDQMVSQHHLALAFRRAVWHTPLCSQRRPVTRCTVGRWCQSCCLNATASPMSPMVWTACTVSTTTAFNGTSSLHTLASFCPQGTTVHTSCRWSTAGEQLLLCSVCSGGSGKFSDGWPDGATRPPWSSLWGGPPCKPKKHTNVSSSFQKKHACLCVNEDIIYFMS